MERNDGRMNLLEVKGLYKSYSGFQLHDITFSLPKGYIMGYIGQNGAGKTTTINLITQFNIFSKNSKACNSCYFRLLGHWFDFLFHSVYYLLYVR